MVQAILILIRGPTIEILICKVLRTSIFSWFILLTIIQGPAEGYYTLMLTINEVKKEDSETSNTLVVKNALGETEYKFTLGLGKKPDPPAGKWSHVKGNKFWVQN